jgi:hypothetical protein
MHRATQPRVYKWIDIYTRGFSRELWETSSNSWMLYNYITLFLSLYIYCALKWDIRVSILSDFARGWKYIYGNKPIAQPSQSHTRSREKKIENSEPSQTTTDAVLHARFYSLGCWWKKRNFSLFSFFNIFKTILQNYRLAMDKLCKF